MTCWILLLWSVWALVVTVGGDASMSMKDALRQRKGERGWGYAIMRDARGKVLVSVARETSVWLRQPEQQRQYHAPVLLSGRVPACALLWVYGGFILGAERFSRMTARYSQFISWKRKHKLHFSFCPTSDDDFAASPQ